MQYNIILAGPTLQAVNLHEMVYYNNIIYV